MRIGSVSRFLPIVAALVVALAASGIVDARRTPTHLNPPSASDFVKVGKNGLDGDRGNSYPWTLKYFKGKVVACTLRHALLHLPALVIGGVVGNLDLAKAAIASNMVKPKNNATATPYVIGTQEWAKELAARCYTLDEKTDTWNLVYTSPITGYPAATVAALKMSNPANLATMYLPDVAGVRWGHVTTDEDDEDDTLYLLGTGIWAIGLPWTRVVRTSDLVTFEDWTFPSTTVYSVAGAALPANWWNLAYTMQPRDIMEISGLVCVPASIIMTGTGLSTDLRPSIHCRDPSVASASSSWSIRTAIPIPGTVNPLPDLSNAFQTHVVFNNKIYWGMQNTAGDGISIWTSSTSLPSSGKFTFKLFMKNSYGNLQYSTPFLMDTCGDDLYISLANGAGYCMFNGTPILGTCGSSLWKIDHDTLEGSLVVGSPVVLPVNSPTKKIGFLGYPSSLALEGFDNEFNHYLWASTTFKNLFFVGTFDSFGPILYMAATSPYKESILQSALAKYINASCASVLAETLVDVLDAVDDTPRGKFAFPEYLQGLVGGDLWVTDVDTCNQYQPVTLNGMGNNFNYGIRTFLVAPYKKQDECLYMGLTNPYSDEPAGGGSVYRWCP